MEEKTINVMDLVMIAWRRIWVIILAVVVFAAAAFCYCEIVLTPKYSATASVLVTNGAVTTKQEANGTSADKVLGSDISASSYLAYTIVDIFTTSDNYEKVAKELGGDYTAHNLMSRSKVVRRSEETLFIDITFTSTDPQEAMDLANEFGRISCKYIPNVFESAKADVISHATKASKTYPKTARTTLVSGVAGAILAYIVLFIIESTNRAIKGEEDFTNNFDVPLLGSVPDFENAESGGYRKSKGRGGYSSGY